MTWWLRPVAIVTGVVLVLVGLLWMFQRRLIYLPDASAVPPAATLVPGASDVVLRDRRRAGSGCLVPAGRPAAPCRPTVLVASGNAGNRQSRAPLAEALAGRRFGVLLLDYRGYGGNPGSPTRSGFGARHQGRADVPDPGGHERSGVDLLRGEPGRRRGCRPGAGISAGRPARSGHRSPTSPPSLGSTIRCCRSGCCCGIVSRSRDHRPSNGADHGDLRDVGRRRAGAAEPGRCRPCADGPIEVVVVPGADHNDRVLLDGTGSDRRRRRAGQPRRLPVTVMRRRARQRCDLGSILAELRCAPRMHDVLSSVHEEGGGPTLMTYRTREVAGR